MAGAGDTISITGLGYTGALNATYGATIGSTLAGVFDQTSWNTYINTVLIDKANIGSSYANTITGNKTIGRGDGFPTPPVRSRFSSKSESAINIRRMVAS